MRMTDNTESNRQYVSRQASSLCPIRSTTSSSASNASTKPSRAAACFIETGRPRVSFRKVEIPRMAAVMNRRYGTEQAKSYVDDC